MPLAIFDLDNTLIGADSDDLWGQYLIEQGVRDADSFGRENKRFYQDYLEGQLDIQAFLRFQLKILSEYPLEQLHAWRADYLQAKIHPVMLPAAHELIEQKRQAGYTLLIVTATNRFLTAPIAELLNIPHLIATEAEMQDGCYTGYPTGIPSFAAGKVTRLNTWLKDQKMDLQDSWFYSDSHNDLPLLEQVSYPVAVDPDPTLRDIAQQRNWSVISLRTEST